MGFVVWELNPCEQPAGMQSAPAAVRNTEFPHGQAVLGKHPKQLNAGSWREICNPTFTATRGTRAKA